MDNLPASVVSPLDALITPDLSSSFLPPSDPSTPSGSTRPPPSSSLLPTVLPHPRPAQRQDISMGSVTTGSNVSSSQAQKRKHNASGMQPPSSKQASKSKTNDLNPVIISNALNSTLNCMANVMERTLDASAPTTSIAPPSIVTSPIDFQPTQLSSAPSQPLLAPASYPEILNQVIRIISAGDCGLTEDELFAASLFFTNASEDAVGAACTFIALGDNQSVKYHFLLCQLDIAGLLPGKGKAKATEDGDNLSMVY